MSGAHRKAASTHFFINTLETLLKCVLQKLKSGYWLSFFPIPSAYPTLLFEVLGQSKA